MSENHAQHAEIMRLAAARKVMHILPYNHLCLADRYITTAILYAQGRLSRRDLGEFHQKAIDWREHAETHTKWQLAQVCTCLTAPLAHEGAPAAIWWANAIANGSDACG